MKFSDFKNREEFDKYCWDIFCFSHCHLDCELNNICKDLNYDSRCQDVREFKKIYDNFVKYYRKEKLRKLLSNDS